MNVIKKLFNLSSLLMSLVCVITLLLVSSTNAYGAQSSYSIGANSDDSVKLYYANSHSEYAGAVVGDGYIAIKNIGNAKNVTIHYSLNNSNNWEDESATYYKTDSDGYEVWHFKTPSYPFYNFKFCIKYEVDGQTYWDNNNGNNYFLDNSATCFGKSLLCVRGIEKATFSDNTQKIFLNIVTKKLTNPGTVKIRYSTDNWATYKDINVDYKYNFSTTNDGWSSTLTFPKDALVQYAVCYTVDGVEYWDNNFGSNYTSNDIILD